MEEKIVDIGEILSKRRTLALAEQINGNNVTELRRQLAIFSLEKVKPEAEPEEIKLIIDSLGGDLDSGLWVYDQIKLLSVPVIGIVVGRCHSTALAILQACRKRYATMNSQFLCHRLVTTVKLDLSDSDERLRTKFELRIEKARESEKRIKNILAQRTGQSLEEIEKMIERGEHTIPFFAPEAKELGFIDGFVEDEPSLIPLL